MKLLPLMAVVLLLSGCIALPIAHDVRRTATVYGTVRDAATGMPISNADVQIADVPSDPAKPPLTAEVQSNAGGSFSIDVRQRQGWFVMFLMGDFFGQCKSRLTVEKAGYLTYTKDLIGSGDPYIDSNPCAGAKFQHDVSLQKAPTQ